MIGFDFVKYTANKEDSSYKQLLDMFMELLHYTNGDASEALNWLTQLDNKMKFTTPEYGIGDFIEDLKNNGILNENNATGQIKLSSKGEQTIRKRSLDEIFGKLKKTKLGNHRINKSGKGDEKNSETKPYYFGDGL